MKVSKSLLILFFLTLVNISSVIAGPNPPAPTAKSSSAAAAAGPPPPPGAPIDQNLLVLLSGALFLGTYTIYKYNSKRKASV